MSINKIILITLIISMSGIVATSGCIDTSQTNNTWGEKKISLENIKVINNTYYRRGENESNYYAYGWIKNDNPYDALEVKIKVTAYYSNGTIFAVNETPTLRPPNIPSKGESQFYAFFADPDQKIAKFDVKIVDAKAEF